MKIHLVILLSFLSALLVRAQKEKWRGGGVCTRGGLPPKRPQMVESILKGVYVS